MKMQAIFYTLSGPTGQGYHDLLLYATLFVQPCLIFGWCTFFGSYDSVFQNSLDKKGSHGKGVF